MKRIKLVLATLTVMAAMLGVISGPAMAQEVDDCEFVGFDGNGDAVFVCDVDFDSIDDRFDDFIDGDFDGDFDGFDDRFFFNNFDGGGVSQSVGQDADSGEVGISFDVS